MDFKLTEEQKLISNTAAQFVQRELLAREGAYLKQTELFLTPGDPPRRELDDEIQATLTRLAKQLGLWALELPEARDGSALSLMARLLIYREFGRTILPFEPPPIPALMADNKHLADILDGRRALVFAFDEVHRTGSLKSIKTRFREIAGGYVLSNTSIDVMNPADGLYLFPAQEEGTERMGLFLLDGNTQGVAVEAEVDLTADATVARMTLRDCKVGSEQLVGYEYEVAAIIAAEQLRIAARSLGIGMRCLANSIDQAAGSTPGDSMDAGGPFHRFAHLHVAYLGGCLAGRSGTALFPSRGLSEEAGSENGLRSRRHGDPDSWRLRCLQRISVRRILPRGAHDAVALWARGRDRSNDRGAIPAERLIALFRVPCYGFRV
jgi:alkylation response protein AidB-like acyl-CoA dehydrogenase